MTELIRAFDLLGYSGLGLGNVIDGVNPALPEECAVCTSNCKESCKNTCTISCKINKNG